MPLQAAKQCATAFLDSSMLCKLQKVQRGIETLRLVDCVEFRNLTRPPSGVLITATLLRLLLGDEASGCSHLDGDATDDDYKWMKQHNRSSHAILCYTDYTYRTYYAILTILTMLA